MSYNDLSLIFVIYVTISIFNKARIADASCVTVSRPYSSLSCYYYVGVLFITRGNINGSAIEKLVI